MTEKYGFVYIWRDRKHNRYYIGSHWGTEDDGYICSSNWMRDAYRKRPSDFKRKIISRIYTKRIDLLEKEQQWINLIKEYEFRNKYYNINSKVFYSWCEDETATKSIKEKISIKTKEAMQRPEVRQKYLDGLKNRKNSSVDPEVRKKKSESMKKTMTKKYPIEDRLVRVKFNSPEYIENMRKSCKQSWENTSEKRKKEIGNKISEGLKSSKQHRIEINQGTFWFNNGKINKRVKTSPGPEWIKGRIKWKQKKRM
jgi:hypothetical protein